MPLARTVADAADAFLARATAPTTRRSYAQTMRALTPAYGDRLLDALDGPAVAALAAHSWGALAPATWNRHVATLRSFTVFCRRTGWLQVDLCAGLETAPGKNRPHQGRRRHLAGAAVPPRGRPRPGEVPVAAAV